MSPVSIASSISITATDVEVDATYRLVDPISLTGIQATILVYEDNLFHEGEYWQHVTRAIYDEEISLIGLNDEATVGATIPLTGWNPDELHAVAYLQDLETKEILQAQRVGQGTAPDYSIYFDERRRSIPYGNDITEFDALLINLSDGADVYTLAPGSQFGDWPLEFFVCGDATAHTTPHDIVLDAGETCEISVRVTTDTSREVRSGSFLVTSNVSGRQHEVDLELYNGSKSVLLVDNDNENDNEIPIMSALDTKGYLYFHWDSELEYNRRTPTANHMNDYDFVIWQTGFSYSGQILRDPQQAAMKRYMDGGGHLFLTSQQLVNLYAEPTEFMEEYLGVTGWNRDRGYDHVDGVPGDPIGDGISADQTYSIPAYKRGDDVIPGPTAVAWCLAPDGSRAGLRNTMPSGTRSVFMPCAFHTFSEVDPDPNNIAEILQRILFWLDPPDTNDTPDNPVSIVSSRIESIQPNPFGERTSIVFRLSNLAAAGKTRLEIFDLEGRRVARLEDGVLSAGPHTYHWDGLSDNGKTMINGVYFARLTTAEGTRNKKLILLR